MSGVLLSKIEKYFAVFIFSRMRSFTFLQAAEFNSFWVVGERYVCHALFRELGTKNVFVYDCTAICKKF